MIMILTKVIVVIVIVITIWIKTKNSKAEKEKKKKKSFQNILGFCINVNAYILKSLYAYHEPLSEQYIDRVDSGLTPWKP